MAESTSDFLADRISLPRFMLTDVLSLGPYVTPVEAKKKSLYNWFVYPHSFSPSLVWYLIDQFHLTEQHRILDPFAGAGTTLLAAKERGISATGIDLLPISASLTRAKVTHYSASHLKKTIDKVRRVLSNTNDKDSGKTLERFSQMLEAPKSILARAFIPDTLNEIARIKSAIETEVEDPNEYSFALVALLYVLESHSLTLKAGGWLKITDAPRNTGSIRIAFLARLDQMYHDIIEFQGEKKTGVWEVRTGDSRITYSDLGLYDAIITSPPYLNRHDYTRVLCLELLVGFLDAYDEITSLRHRLLRSHVEARPLPTPEGYTRPSLLDDVLDELRSRNVDKRVLYIVNGYFEDMHLTLSACAKYLAQGGSIAFVVGNVRFSGLGIPVDQILAEIGQSVGLCWQSTLVARRRNNSAQQMRDYGRDPSRESIVIWHKT